ncbi:hypothetical protein [Curtobacterium sp. MCBD17_040]|uniref:hypothetical protein n=1 Tax=Curtobacterium sp. MCBD17_040 TaxID=2175674 RepID=UPI0011B5084E|nr:hypothetical protein [Curtobacterium sp. MCBD17_040]WIB65932.1 hypothetical protein DEI94_17605 [Curtobacterium sp. MCBD17_040]
MSDQKPERPGDLRTRRRPQAAADERVDPVDYRQTEPAPTATPTPAPVESSPTPPAPRRGRPRREVTVPFSTRLALDVQDLIDAAVDGGEGTIRSVVEEAIRAKYGEQYGASGGGSNV